MRKFLIKSITLFLIFNLFLVRGVIFIPPVYGQNEPPPPPSAPLPPSAPSNQSSPPPPPPPPPPPDVPPPPPNALPPPPSAPSAPLPPSGPPINQLPTSGLMPTAPALPTNSSLPTSGTLPTEAASSNGTTPLPSQAALGPKGSANGESSGDATNNSEGNGGEEGSSSESVNDPANVNTGPFSSNSATETLEQKYETLNKNLAELQNKIDAISSTGFNYANLNTLDGQVFTGDALSTLNLLNKLNSNMTGIGGFSVFNIYDTYVGDIIFKFADGNVSDSFSSASGTVSKNSTTGPGSGNQAIAEDTFKVKEANGNDAQITNEIVLQATSGNNTSSYNTGNGTVETGNATVMGNIVNMTNTNLNVTKWLWGVVNIFGKLIGNIILPQETENNTSGVPSASVSVENDNTGPASANSSTYQNSSLATFENVNQAEIESNVDVAANTGNNTASVNTGGGAVLSGNSDVAVSNTTIANANTVQEEDTVWMVIVNEAGRWIGHIIGEPWGSTAASNSLPLSQTTGGSGAQIFSTLVENSQTGPLSENISTYTNTSETEIANENIAGISNNITANADTGNNESSFNTGAGTIETGDAKVGLNLVNMANTNVAAKKFVAILINVLDKWLGNVITPNYQVELGEESAEDTTPGPLGTITLELNAEYIQNTPTPTPTTYQSPSSPPTGDVELIPSTTPTPTATYESSIASTDNYNQYWQYYNTQQYLQAYYQALDKVLNARKKIASQKERVLQQNVATKKSVEEEAKKLKRGVFLSAAFAKATETSLPGILLGGARSLKVNQSWLSVVPLAVFILLLRRRRKFDISKYINALLEILL